MSLLEFQQAPPSWAALAAFAVLASAHLDEEDLLLETEVHGLKRRAQVRVPSFESAHSLAAFLGAELEPGASEFQLEGRSPTGSGRLSGRLLASAGLVHLDLLAWEGLAGAAWAASHFEQLLKSIQRDPSTRPDHLSMLSPAERALLLGPHSGAAHDPRLTRGETLPQLFQETASRHAGRPAVVEDGWVLTYANLEAEANRIAHLLQLRGLGPGALVGHWLPRGFRAYAALLGILKAGAAYVPLDPELPPARVRQVAAECGMHLLLARHPGTLPGLACPVLDLAALAPELQALPATAPGIAVGTEEPAYVIFTSGSTGTPKGVPITHRSACTLVRAEAQLFAVRAEDRVFQGFSLAFDASVEELWLAWASGACLVTGTRAIMQSGPELGRRLAEAGVTIFSTVPTLLSLVEDAIPSLRLLILGGESCPADLVTRWWRPGLRLVNTYGPTEATVIATWADLRPDQPVTIGRAVPNDRVYVLDGLGRLCPIGVPGELHLSGAGLASGYLGRPELTRERFLSNPFAEGPFTERLYRTGDRVRFNDGGDLEYLGRTDAQVKLRGFRIELEEIETVLRLNAAVLAAAVTVWRDDGLERLVAYVVPRPGSALEEDLLLRELRERLPAYMVPASIEALAALPTLASGKVDRKRLPAPVERATAPPPVQPLKAGEERLTTCWTRLFHGRRPGLDEDFFRDLGGHSLVAAAMVSELRKEPGFTGLAMPDVYAFPTIRALAAELEVRAARGGPVPAAPPELSPKASPGWHRLCTAAQVLSLYPILGFYALQWMSPYLVYSWSQDQDLPRATGIAAALLSLALVYPAMYLLSIAAKWLLLGRIRPGRHRIWGFYYWRWWLTHRILAATPLDYLVESPLLGWYFRLMGARIGRNVHLGTTSLAAFDLIQIGADTSIGMDARLSGYTLEAGFLELGPVQVGRRCRVGNRSILSLDTSLEDGAVLEDLALLPAHGRIPSGQRWVGSPARPLPLREADRQRLSTALAPVSSARRFGFGLAQALGAFMVPMAFLAAVFPGLILINELYANTNGYFAYLVVAPLVALSFVVLLALEIATAKWLLLGRVQPGTYSLHSGFILRKWYVDRLMDMGLDLLAPLYATLYLPPWFRLLGARMGPWSEVSTAGSGAPDLLDIGEESFIADCVSFGPPQADLGQVTLAATKVGRRAFVGNSALVPAGTVLGDSVLVGVLSVPPTAPEDAARVDSAWLGSPAIYLPHRQESGAFGEEATFRPRKRMVLLRAFIEQFRVIAPATGFVVLTSLLLTAMTELEAAYSLRAAVLSLPLLYLGGGLLACLFVVAVKWLVMGRYHPGERPLWCSFVWRTELVSSLHENLADAWLLRLLQGTPLVPLYFRLLGSRIGRRVCMESTWLTEYDLVTIRDEACLNADCTVQTHLFEDRVMKMDPIDIGAGCSVGTDAVVLYGSVMEAGSVLGDLSLLMKGETLPAGTRWEGSPAQPSAPLLRVPAAPPAGEAKLLRPGEVQLSFQPEALSTDHPAALLHGLVKLAADAQGRPRVQDGQGRAWSFSRAQAPGVVVQALSRDCRIGVDLEVLTASRELDQASELFLPGERAWVESLPEPERWLAFLRLWTAKEAVLKALGQGFAFGLEQVELGPDAGAGVQLLRLGGSEALARGWRIEHHQHQREGRSYLVALAVGQGRP